MSERSLKGYPSPADLPERFGKQVAADWVGVSVRTWERWDRLGETPAAVHLGKSKEYRKATFLAWYASRKHAVA